MKRFVVDFTVISGGGHGAGVDWWTLGVLLFEMLASYPPFYHEDPMKTYAKIMYGKLSYPKYFSDEVVDAIKAFLCLDAEKRMGTIEGGGIDRIKQHEWFKEFEWELLVEGEMEAPIIPTIRNEQDRSNFQPAQHKEGDEEELRQERKDAEEYVDDGSGWDKHF